VLEVEDLEDDPIDVDVIAALELVRRDDEKSGLCRDKRRMVARRRQAHARPGRAGSNVKPTRPARR
jgi:hypothetical protein